MVVEALEANETLQVPSVSKACKSAPSARGALCGILESIFVMVLLEALGICIAKEALVPSFLVSPYLHRLQYENVHCVA